MEENITTMVFLAIMMQWLSMWDNQQRILQLQALVLMQQEIQKKLISHIDTELRQSQSNDERSFIDRKQYAEDRQHEFYLLMNETKKSRHWYIPGDSISFSPIQP